MTSAETPWRLRDENHSAGVFSHCVGGPFIRSAKVVVGEGVSCAGRQGGAGRHRREKPHGSTQRATLQRLLDGRPTVGSATFGLRGCHTTKASSEIALGGRWGDLTAGTIRGPTRITRRGMFPGRAARGSISLRKATCQVPAGELSSFGPRPPTRAKSHGKGPGIGRSQGLPRPLGRGDKTPSAGRTLTSPTMPCVPLSRARTHKSPSRVRFRANPTSSRQGRMTYLIPKATLHPLQPDGRTENKHGLYPAGVSSCRVSEAAPERKLPSYPFGRTSSHSAVGRRALKD
jgi:hypothetical protein